MRRKRTATASPEDGPLSWARHHMSSNCHQFAGIVTELRISKSFVRTSARACASAHTQALAAFAPPGTDGEEEKSAETGLDDAEVARDVWQRGGAVCVGFELLNFATRADLFPRRCHTTHNSQWIKRRYNQMGRRASQTRRIALMRGARRAAVLHGGAVVHVAAPPL